MTVLQRLTPEILGLTKGGTRGGGARRIGYLLVGFCAVALVLALLRETAAAIIATWITSATFNYGFLILPICFYLAWQKRAELALITPSPDLRGLVLVVLAALAWLAGHVTGTLVVQELSLAILIQTLILTMYGWPLCRVLIFPLLYLFFAVPMGEALIPPLQSVTAASAVTLLRWVGVPVFSNGNIISIPTGNFYVAEACSGTRYLIGSLAVGVLFAGLMYRSWLRRGLFLVMSMIVPIIANGVRAFGIILIAYLTDNEFAVGVDHIIYGWLFFSLVTFVVLGIGSSFRDREDLAPASAPPHMGGRLRSVVNVALVGVVALIPMAAAKVYGDHIDALRPSGSVRLGLPEVAGYRRLEARPDPYAPTFAGADAQAGAVYAAPGGAVDLYIGYYRSERRDAAVVSFDHRLVGGPHWILGDSGTVTTMIGGERHTVQSARFVQGNHGRVIWYWYWVDGRLTGDPYLAKLLQAKVKLFGGPRQAAIILVAADYGDADTEARHALRLFTAKLDGLVPDLKAASAPRALLPRGLQSSGLQSSARLSARPSATARPEPSQE